MLDIGKATAHLLQSYQYDPEKFYGPAHDRSLGAGLIYASALYPLFNRDDMAFDTVEGIVYVLTHECDVAQENERHFNKDVLLCPIIPFENFAQEFVESESEGALFGIIPDIGRDRIYRLFYFPPVQNELPHGGILFLNKVASTDVSVFYEGRARALCCLSWYSFQILDYKLHNHLFRPKAEVLPRLV